MASKKIQYGTNEINIKKFDLKKLSQKNPTVLLIAPRRSGKSWIIRDILYQNNDIPVGVIIAPTDRMTKFYEQNFYDAFIYYEFKTKILFNLFERQKKMIAKKKQKAIEGKKVDTRAFLIMDDCLSTKGEWAKDPLIAQVMLEGRHYDIFYMLTTQYAISIGPDLRTNFDYIFLLSDNNIDNQEKMRKNFAGIFPNLAAFQEVYFPCTENHGALVIDASIKSHKIEDVVYWYRAKDLSNLHEKFGNKEAIEKFYRTRYDPNYANKLKSIGTFFLKKKRYDVKVKLENNDDDDDDEKKKDDDHDESDEKKQTRPIVNEKNHIINEKKQTLPIANGKNYVVDEKNKKK
jgi:hypothetical protein